MKKYIIIFLLLISSSAFGAQQWNGSTSTDITDQANWDDGVSGVPGNGADVSLNHFDGGYYPWSYYPASINLNWASIFLAGLDYDISTFEGSLTIQADNFWGGYTITANDRTNSVIYSNDGDGSGGTGDGIALAGDWSCTMNCDGSGSSYLNNTGTFDGTLNLNSGGVDLFAGDTYGGTVNAYAVNVYSTTFTTCNWYAGNFNATGVMDFGTCYVYGDMDASTYSGTVAGTFYPIYQGVDLSFPDTGGTKVIHCSRLKPYTYSGWVNN